MLLAQLCCMLPLLPLANKDEKKMKGHWVLGQQPMSSFLQASIRQRDLVRVLIRKRELS